NAWCYGDPGVAATCWAAAERIGEPVDEWRDLALAAAARPEADCLVEGAGLCHGAYGLAHLFNRCFQASGDARFADASRRWFAHGLAIPLPREHDLMLGKSGIGLALLAALGDEEPGWDRLLACDIPPMDHAAGGSDSV
ncbi:MAG TPA: lanthionine synthetase LanC family protein, partial [Kofleriaceae bacterium]|nr:lanthionine synthetase LanC family protein [Kofleriaceae bacterium]